MLRINLLLLFTAVINICSAQFYKIHDFNGVANGTYPTGSFASDGNFLYGATYYGGISSTCGPNGCGTIYKIKTDGTGYVKLMDFDDPTTGSSPTGALYSDGTFLYGMARNGGSATVGTIYKILHDGTGYEKLHDFVGFPTDGSYPVGNLISDGTFLYGMTNNGGANNRGVIFKIKPDGTSYSTILSFDGTAKGSNPTGSLIWDGTDLLGMARGGGIANTGVVFKIKPDGTGFIKLHNFDVFGGLGGTYPEGALVSDGTYLYGMTHSGGIGYGIIFKIKPDGTAFTKMMDFNNTNGNHPYGSFILNGTTLYGMTCNGGAEFKGIVFKISTGGTGFQIMHDFDGPTGVNPFGTLFSDGIFLYGGASGGGTGACAGGCGTIFKNQVALSPDCIGHFTTTYDSVANNFIVNVDPTTSAVITGYLWDFGDGATSTAANPSHIYAVDSLYNLCMKMYISTGDSCTYCRVIGKDSLGNIYRSGGFTLNVQNGILTGDLTLDDRGNLEVFPNPNNGIFQIRSSAGIKINSAEVFNVLGEKIVEFELNSGATEMNLSDLPAGVYFCRVRMDREFFTEKICIQK